MPILPTCINPLAVALVMMPNKIGIKKAIFLQKRGRSRSPNIFQLFINQLFTTKKKRAGEEFYSDTYYVAGFRPARLPLSILRLKTDNSQ
jgi:hypothetical protein